MNATARFLVGTWNTAGLVPQVDDLVEWFHQVKKKTRTGQSVQQERRPSVASSTDILEELDDELKPLLKSTSSLFLDNGQELVTVQEESPPDVVVLCLQEFDLTCFAYLKRNKQRQSLLVQRLHLALAQCYETVRYSENYYTESVAGLFMVAMIREQGPWHVREWQSNWCGTGWSFACNKGGLCIRLLLEHEHGIPFSVLFVNAHLAAHPHRVKRRAQDCLAIARRLVLPCLQDKTKSSCWTDAAQLVILAGDLNYRLDERPLRDSVTTLRQAMQRTRVAHERLFTEFKILNHPHPTDWLSSQYDAVEWRIWQKFLSTDQLRRERAQGHLPALNRFKEATIRFAPTFKYDTSVTHEPFTRVSFDTSSKKRLPAWCDRVLVSSDTNLVQTVFEGYASGTRSLSDHRPVCALIQCKIVQGEMSSTISSSISVDPYWREKQIFGYLMGLLARFIVALLPWPFVLCIVLFVLSYFLLL